VRKAFPTGLTAVQKNQLQLFSYICFNYLNFAPGYTRSL
jgi:hypothetical protein